MRCRTGSDGTVSPASICALLRSSASIHSVGAELLCSTLFMSLIIGRWPLIFQNGRLMRLRSLLLRHQIGVVDIFDLRSYVYDQFMFIVLYMRP